jgi:hypothetical protein
MNVLLYVPGLLLLQYKAIGPVKMVLNVALMAFVQVRRCLFFHQSSPA